jgi:hypothetical protein
MFRSFFMLVVFILLAFVVSGHQPRLVSDELTVVENPEVSQAFYAKLKGRAAFYRIESDVSFTLYVSILVPDMEGIGRDVSAEITFKPYGNHTHGDETFLLDASSVRWVQYYEEFAGDSYYRGPEFRREVGPGVYEVRVFSPDNEGKYVLVVGEEEVFTLTDMVDTIFALPKLKQDFFGKSPLTAFFNLIGFFLVVLLLITFGVGFSLFRLFKRFREKNKEG